MKNKHTDMSDLIDLIYTKHAPRIFIEYEADSTKKKLNKFAKELAGVLENYDFDTTIPVLAIILLELINTNYNWKQYIEEINQETTEDTNMFQ